MTVTVEAGLALAALQKELATHHQWLPIDPPNAENVTIHELLARDLSGPRRFGHGTIREHLIGMKVVLADGRTIKSGGKVVKNVAGYDLAKLFIGARDSLGIIVEATFKLRPLPEVERFVCREVAELNAARTILRAALDSELTPVIVDAHRGLHATGLSIVLGFAGTAAEVDWQSDVARSLSFEKETSLAYEKQFWSDGAPVNCTSILPSRLIETLAQLDRRPVVARAGNGLIYYRGEALPQKNHVPTELMQRLKRAYDPKNILPELMA